MRFSNNQKWAYQSISHEIMKYCYWMTSSQSECHYTQWVKINSRKSELTLMRISKRIHQIIKVIDRILILFVSKKNDTKQLCVNYRQLNKITKQDSYFLLLIKRVARPLSRVKWFTSLNLKEAYYQVQMKKGRNENSISNKIQTL
jgi:hypothetical protein